MDLHHPILKEFPQHRDVIKRLRLSDERFRKAFEDYHAVDEQICRIEDETVYAVDQEIDELKLKRARLKDLIYHAITHEPSATSGGSR